MRKDKLIALIADRLNGGVTNSDNARKFDKRDVELTISLAWGSLINQLGMADIDISNMRRRRKISITDNIGLIDEGYIDIMSGFPASFAEDESSSFVMYPRKSNEARLAMNMLEVSRSITTFTIAGRNIRFDNLPFGCEEVYVWLFPSFHNIEASEELSMPPGAELTLFDTVAQRLQGSLNIPIDNVNDNA